LQKVPQIDWLPQQRPLSDLKANIRLIIPTHMSIKAEYLVNINQAYSEIIRGIRPFLQYFHRITKMSKRFSGVTAPNLTIFVHV